MTSSRKSFPRTGSASSKDLSIRDVGGPLLQRRRPRAGIVGGGLAGVSCGWLLDGVADAVLFESGPILSGHAHTISTDVNGRDIQVDVGAQFFARGPYPNYVKLLEVLGLLVPETPARDVTIDAEMSITVTESSQKNPRFVSPTQERRRRSFSPWNAAGLWAFLVFALAAKRLSHIGNWFVPLDAWLQELPVRAEERERLLLPLVSAMVGCSS